MVIIAVSLLVAVVFLEVWPLTNMVAVRPKQKALIHYTKAGGMPLAVSFYSSLSLYILL